MNKLIRFFFASILLTIISVPAYAQLNTNTDSVTDTSSGLEISPAVIEISGKPGTSITKEITVKNPLDKAVTLYLLSKDFYTDDQNGTPLFYNDDEGQTKSSYQLSKWVTFIEESITLQPNQSRQVEYTITIPSNAEPGGHYAGVMFSTSKPVSTTGSSTQVGAVGLISSLVFLTVDGAITEQLEIKEFSATKFTTSGPINFNVVVKNNGNVHLTPKGSVKVTNWQGKEIKNIELNTTFGKALPKAERKFTDKWENDWKHFGYYNLTASLTYGKNNTLVDSTVKVLILPIWLIAALAALVLIIIILIIRKIRGGKDEDILGDTNNPTPSVPTPSSPAPNVQQATVPPTIAATAPTPAITPTTPAPTATPVENPTPAVTPSPVVTPAPVVTPTPATTETAPQATPATAPQPTEPSVTLEVNAPEKPKIPAAETPKTKKSPPPTDSSAKSA
ncbi:DUF916 domain-containing protein [Candidatus Berkelbacteria bacterium]|nr:DUF916 domain-containing protein [Candidatus Berkelbacteria bacterium]